MNAFEQGLVQYFGAEGLKKIQAVQIGIAGLGGLGSNCACALARSGFCKFTLCDFDRVEYANLNRQFYFLDQVGSLKTEALQANLLRINPDLEFTLFQQKLDAASAERIFAPCQVVVEGFDRAESKGMLAEVFLNSGKLLVSASGLAGWGKSDEIRTRRIKEHFFLIGDHASEASKSLPPCAPRVAVAAAKEADVVLSWVLGNR